MRQLPLSGAADAPPAILDGALVGLSQQGPRLGEDLFDRVQVRAVRWQEHQMCPGFSDGLPDDLALVNSEVVEHHEVARAEGRDQSLLDPRPPNRSAQPPAMYPSD
jgi:hypothetical protein